MSAPSPRIIIVRCPCGDDALSAIAGFALGVLVGLMVGGAAAAVVVAGMR